VRSLDVIDSAELVEPTLLRTEIGAGRCGGLFLEGSMHALVPAVLVGTRGLDELGEDTEGDPPDGELGEPSDGDGGERVAVVSSDTLRKTELLEETAKAADCGLEIEAEHAVAVEEEPGVAILNGEGKAEVAVLGAELALEVGGPGGVGFREDGKGRSRSGPSTLGFLGFDAAMPGEDPVDGIGTGSPEDGGILLELFADLPSAPAALLPDREDAVHHGRWGGMRAGPGPMGTVLEAAQALVSIASKPLVARGSADVMATTEIGVGEVGELGFEGEAGAFSLHGGSPPRHRQLPVEGAPRLRGEL
jgi:hypothetical protein